MMGSGLEESNLSDQWPVGGLDNLVESYLDQENLSSLDGLPSDSRRPIDHRLIEDRESRTEFDWLAAPRLPQPEYEMLPRLEYQSGRDFISNREHFFGSSGSSGPSLSFPEALQVSSIIMKPESNPQSGSNSNESSARQATAADASFLTMSHELSNSGAREISHEVQAEPQIRLSGDSSDQPHELPHFNLTQRQEQVSEQRMSMLAIEENSITLPMQELDYARTLYYYWRPAKSHSLLSILFSDLTFVDIMGSGRSKSPRNLRIQD